MLQNVSGRRKRSRRRAISVDLLRFSRLGKNQAGCCCYCCCYLTSFLVKETGSGGTNPGLARFPSHPRSGSFPSPRLPAAHPPPAAGFGTTDECPGVQEQLFPANGLRLILSKHQPPPPTVGSPEILLLLSPEQ